MSSTMQPTSWKPRSFQSAGVIKMIAQACAGLFYKPGLGKTSVTYMAFRILQEKGYIPRMLVICPLRPAYVVWPEQKKVYEEFKHFKVNVLHGPDKEDLLNDADCDIAVVNPEGLKWLFGGDEPNIARVRWIAERYPMLVVDESTKFKDSSTKRFKLLKKVLKYFKRRYVLTGSPRPKALEDLFGQCYIMDEGANLGRYITGFRTKYMYPSGFGGYDWKPQPGAMEAVAEKMAPLVQVVEQKGNVEVPELLYADRMILLPPPVRARYRDMEEQMMLDIAEGRVVAANAAVASSKCRQICNGAIYVSDGVWEPVHELKLDALEDLLEELQGDPLLITYEFKFDAERIAKRLKIPSISTGNPIKDRDTVQAFSRGELPAVMGQPQSVALGTDGLQNSCSSIAMVGVPWSFLNYEQVIDRVRRQGNKAQSVTVYRILCQDTVDERVIKVLATHDRAQASFMTALQRS